jgi:hypothetical protein
MEMSTPLYHPDIYHRVYDIDYINPKGAPDQRRNLKLINLNNSGFVEFQDDDDKKILIPKDRILLMEESKDSND